MIALLVLLTLLIVAGVVSALDMRPQQRPPEWSVGRMLQGGRD